MEAEYKDETMKATTNKTDTEFGRFHEELALAERDTVSTEEVLRDSSAGRNAAVRLLRDWRQQYRGSLLCQK
jgi:hypothetical protein